MFLTECATSANIERRAYLGSGNDVVVGSRSSVGIRCELHGPVRLGDNVMMGPDVICFTVNHLHSSKVIPMIDQGNGPARPVVISDDVWIGARSILLPGVKIGSGTIIAAGSVVTRSIPSNVIAGGNPCRVIKERGM